MKVYRGTSGLLLYVQAYQLILRQQCHALIQTVGWPAQIETVIKDLWELRLQLLSDRFEQDESDAEILFSSQPVEGIGDTGNYKGKARWASKPLPTLIESLAICYLAAIILRLPISISELHDYAYREDVPYIRAIRSVPADMKKRLPAEYVKALDTTSPLAFDHLRRAIHQTCLLYQHHFKLELPPLNTPLLLYKYVKDLALPTAVYEATCKIAALLSVDFFFPTLAAKQRVTGLPEIALMSVLIIAVKLLYPFSKDLGSVRSMEDPAVLAVDWEAWVASHQSQVPGAEGETLGGRGSEIEVTEDDIMAMTGKQMDEYLDWYERTWVDEDRAQSKLRGPPDELLQMFPLGRQDGSHPQEYNAGVEAAIGRNSTQRRLTDMISKLRTRDVVAEVEDDEVRDDLNEMGSAYQRYRSSDDLTPHARAFHEAAAQRLAVTPKTLLVAVNQMERRLIVWRWKQVKSGGGDPDEENSSDNMRMGDDSLDEDDVKPREPDYTNVM